MSKPPINDLTEAKKIAARMLAMPPQPHNAPKKAKAKPGSKPPKRTSGKGRARVGKSRT